MKQTVNQKLPNKSKIRHLLTVEFPDADLAWVSETASARCDSMGSVVREAVREKKMRSHGADEPASKPTESLIEHPENLADSKK